MIKLKKATDGTFTLTIEGIQAPGNGRDSASGKSEVLWTTGAPQAVALPDGTQGKVNATVFVPKR